MADDNRTPERRLKELGKPVDWSYEMAFGMITRLGQSAVSAAWIRPVLNDFSSPL